MVKALRKDRHDLSRNNASFVVWNLWRPWNAADLSRAVVLTGKEN